MTKSSPNYDRDIAGLLRAAECGDLASQLELGSLYYEGDGAFIEKNSKKCFYWFAQAAHLGSAEAQFLLGGFYEMGYTVKPNPKKAAAWYAQAAQQGVAAGHYALGMCCYYGFGIEENKQKAVEQFSLAAGLGDADAQYMLGICYENGEGVELDLFESHHYYELAAKQGYDDAMYALGRSLILSSFEDRKLARYWLYEAVKLGHHEAHKLLVKIEHDECA